MSTSSSEQGTGILGEGEGNFQDETMEEALAVPVSPKLATETPIMPSNQNLDSRQLKHYLSQRGITEKMSEENRLLMTENLFLKQEMSEARTEAKNSKIKMDMIIEKLREAEKRNDAIQMNINANSFTRTDHGKMLPPNTGTGHQGIPLATEIRTCRCSGRCCMFSVLSEMTNKVICKTPSPTQCIRMMRIVKKFPEMESRPEELMLISQTEMFKNLKSQVSTAPPNVNELKQLSHCSTLALVCQDIPDWKLALDQSVGEIVESLVGKELLNPQNALIIVSPGVDQKQVPLIGRMVLHMECGKGPETLYHENAKEKFNMVILIVPFDISKAYQKEWQEVITNTSKEIDVLVIPAPTKGVDYRAVVEYAELLKGLNREEGELHVLSPLSEVSSMQHKPLHSIRESCSIKHCWNTIYKCVRDLGWTWPSFRLEKEEGSVERDEAQRRARPEQTTRHSYKRPMSQEPPLRRPRMH